MFDLFDCYDTVCMIQDENVGIHFNFGFHHSFIEDFDCFFLSLNIISLWAFLREFLFHFHFSFSVAIRKKGENTHPDTNVQSENRQEQKN